MYEGGKDWFCLATYRSTLNRHRLSYRINLVVRR